MTQPQPQERRRLDRVLAAGFSDDLASLDLDELRRRRDDVAQEETDLSYLRRLLHARMDLVRTEQGHRAGAPGSTVDDLVEVLGAGVVGPAHGSGRFLTLTPSRPGEYGRSTEALLADPSLSDVTGLDDAALVETLDVYAVEEESVSGQRHRVQVVMDECNAEIGRRYRDGAASVDGLLAAQRAAYPVGPEEVGPEEVGPEEVGPEEVGPEAAGTDAAGTDGVAR